MFNSKEKKTEIKKYDNELFDNNTLKIIVIASIIIIISIIITGSMSFIITEKQVVKKLKSKDLVYIAQSISAKIDGRIGRANETSIILSKDPVILQWVRNGEVEKDLEGYAKQKIIDIVSEFDYNNSFIVSTVTNHYWSEEGKIIDTMSESDPDDSWFFEKISSKEPVTIEVDYNNERQGTFVFINALMGNVNKPLAVTGVGLNLKDIAQEFQKYYSSGQNDLWLVGNKGTVFISGNLNEVGKNITEFVPVDIWQKANTNNPNEGSNIIEYKHTNGEIYDLIFQSLNSTDWHLVFQVPRSESLSIISAIKINTAIGSLFTIILLIIIFYLISKNIANPYKRAVLLSQELEKKVDERTRELSEKNTRIIESIEYARMVQSSVFPPPREIKEVFEDFFILWQPKDIVGGDFYWLKRIKDSYVMVVGDCTGHGVPAALMTMAVNSMLNYTVNENCYDNPALILKNINQLFKSNINKEKNKIEDGLDVGVIYIMGKKMVYAGAKTSLYIRNEQELKIIIGDKKTIGYKRTENDFEFTNHEMNIDEKDVFYISTDGYFDQNGGEENHSFGKNRFKALINSNFTMPLNEQKEIFMNELNKYMKEEHQRDDITVIGFKFFD